MRQVSLAPPPHVRGVADLPEVQALLRTALELKRTAKRGVLPQFLAGKTVLLLFERHSTRTRVSFEVGVQKLGGMVVSLDSGSSQIARGESLEDTARVLSRYADCIVHRARDHAALTELAAHATVPVLNALTDIEHPLQALADVMTMEEHIGPLATKKLAWVGDGNNVCHSLMLIAPLVGMDMHVATPSGYGPDPAIVAAAQAAARGAGTRLVIGTSPRAAVRGAHAVATDTWVSMGDDAERDARLAAFRPFQVTEALLRHGARGCIFLHCLPGHWGEEATADVAHGPRSVIYDEAENRMWSQMALLVHLLHGRPVVKGAA